MLTVAGVIALARQAWAALGASRWLAGVRQRLDVADGGKWLAAGLWAALGLAIVFAVWRYEGGAGRALRAKFEAAAATANAKALAAELDRRQRAERDRDTALADLEIETAARIAAEGELARAVAARQPGARVYTPDVVRGVYK